MGCPGAALMIPVGPFQFRTFCDHQAELMFQTVNAQLCKSSFKLVFMPQLRLPKYHQCIPQRQEFIPIARATLGQAWSWNPGQNTRASPPCPSEREPTVGREEHPVPCLLWSPQTFAAPASEYPGLLSLFHHSISARLVSHANT